MHKVPYILTSIITCICISLSSCSKSKLAPEPDIIHSSQLPAGWYNHDATKLNQELDEYLEIAQKHFPVSTQSNAVKALIVPHAGYYYSGLAAATAYQTMLEPHANLPLEARKNKQVKRVIILAPSHTTFYNGIALPGYTVFDTVLGDIPVDTQTIKALDNRAGFRTYQFAHDKEHAIEMQLPFLQKTILGFSIIPLVVGHMAPVDIFNTAKLLNKIIDDTTLVVVSSDFVHHGKSYDFDLFDKNILDHVRLVDSYAMQAVAHQSLETFNTVLRTTNATICGREAIKILLTLIKMNAFKSVQAQLSCYYTSAHLTQARQNNFVIPALPARHSHLGDGLEPGSIDAKKLLNTVPDSAAQNSVSYLAMVFTEPTKNLTGYEKQALLTLARRTLENAFKNEQEQLPENLLFPIVSTMLGQPAGAFVTLKTKDGQLRGCMGRIVSSDPLCTTVHDMALASAFQDTRFAPLTKNELENIRIEISVLTPPVKIENPDQIKIGSQGIILNKLDGTGKTVASAVFLPQVPKDFGWDLHTTLEQLSLKAGLDRDAWKEGCMFEVFESTVIEESNA